MQFFLLTHYIHPVDPVCILVSVTTTFMVLYPKNSLDVRYAQVSHPVSCIVLNQQINFELSLSRAIG